MLCFHSRLYDSNVSIGSIFHLYFCNQGGEFISCYRSLLDLVSIRYACRIHRFYLKADFLKVGQVKWYLNSVLHPRVHRTCRWSTAIDQLVGLHTCIDIL
jgi:hypothetical protein